MRDRNAHCPVCAEPGVVRISKIGRPFYSCRHCHSKIFMNSERAALRFKAADQAFPMYLKAYRQQLTMQYRRTIELDADGSRNAVGLQRAREVSAAKEKIEKALSAVHAEILRAGRSCILCCGPAEFRTARKGEIQLCRFCSAQSFIHGPLGRAGLITRRMLLLIHFQNRREAARRPPIPPF
jgi:hypothetical protein